MNERGSTSLLVPVFVALGIVLIVFIVTLATILGARARAQAAADAAALAAAPVTFRPFGASGSALDEAHRYAELNGAQLVECRCESNPTYASRVVTVTVEVVMSLPMVGPMAVPATARAEFAPAELLFR